MFLSLLSGSICDWIFADNKSKARRFHHKIGESDRRGKLTEGETRKVLILFIRNVET